MFTPRRPRITRPRPKPHELARLDPKIVHNILKAAALHRPGSQSLGRHELSMGTLPGMEAIDAARNQAGIPEPETFAQWDEQGKQITDDPARKQELIDKVNRLEFLTKGEGRGVVNTIIPEMSDQAVRDVLNGKTTPGTLSDAEQFMDNYRQQGAEAARAHAARRDPFETPAERAGHATVGKRAKAALARMAITPPGNITKTLRAMKLDKKRSPRRTYSVKEMRAIQALKDWQRDLRNMFAAWAADGIYFNNLDERAELDAKVLRRVVRDMERLVAIHAESEFFEPYVEFLRISIFSGPITHVRNFTGAVLALTDVLLMQPVASVARGEWLRPTFASWRQLISPRGWHQAWSNFWFTWTNDGYNMFQLQHPGFFSKEGELELEEQHRPKITGYGVQRRVTRAITWLAGTFTDDKNAARLGREAGKIASAPVRWLGRGGRFVTLAFMVATDQLATTIHATANVAGYAVVKGKEAGLKPGSQKFIDFVDGQILDRNSASWTASAANGETALATFRDDAGWVESKFQRVRGKYPVLNWIAPVVKFSFKLPRRVAGHLPTAALYIAYRVGRGKITSKKYGKEYTNRELSQDFAKWFIGSAVAWGLFDWSDDEKDEGWRFTGPPATLPYNKGKRLTESEVVPPYSYRLSKDGPWRSYRNIEPLSGFLAMNAVFADAVRDLWRGRLDKLDVATKAYSRIHNLIVDMPTLQTIKQFHRIVEKPFGYHSMNFATGVMNMHVPNAFRVAVASTDDIVRTRRIRPGENMEDALLKLSLYNVPYAGKLPPKVGIFGDDLKVMPVAPANLIAAITPDIIDAVMLTRLFAPSRPYFTHSGNKGAMLEMLMDWNIAHPQAGQAYWISEPSDRVTVKMEGPYHKSPQVGLNNAEYYLYKKAAQMQLGNMVDKIEWPEVGTMRHIESIKGLVKRSRVQPLRLMKIAAQAKIDGNMDKYAQYMARLSAIAHNR
jgi:hypothetical protein